MRVRSHIITSAVLAGIIYFIFKSAPMAVSVFFGGILMDLDHVLECYLNFGLKFNVFKTIDVCENCRLKKAHLFLHSYELLLILALLIYWQNLGQIWLGATIGLTAHIVFDMKFNCLYSNSLFFVKRWKVGFDALKIIDAEAQRQKNKDRRQRDL